MTFTLSRRPTFTKEGASLQAAVQKEVASLRQLALSSSNTTTLKQAGRSEGRKNDKAHDR